MLENHFEDYKGAIQYLNQALSIDPKLMYVHWKVSQIFYERFQDHKRARQHLEEVITINPKHVNSRLQLAKILLKDYNDYEASRHHLEMALDCDPNRVSAHLSLGFLLRDHFADDEGARRHFQLASEIDIKNGFSSKNNTPRHFEDGGESNSWGASTYKPYAAASTNASEYGGQPLDSTAAGKINQRPGEDQDRVHVPNDLEVVTRFLPPTSEIDNDQWLPPKILWEEGGGEIL